MQHRVTIVKYYSLFRNGLKALFRALGLSRVDLPPKKEKKRKL